MSDNERMPMVSWFDPKQLVRTGLEILVSSLFARYMDRRQIQAIATGPGVYYEFDQSGMQVRPLRPVAARIAGVARGTFEAVEGPPAPAPAAVSAEELVAPYRRPGGGPESVAADDFWL